MDSVQASTMLSNSEFIVMLNQAASDREELAKLLNISNEQMSYITNADPGCGLIKYTGDIHGMPWNIVKFSKKYHLTEDDVIVILGDVGANYYCDDRDRECKAALNKVKPTILCIHGNHEARPSTLPQYQLKEWNGGLVWYEKDYPNLLFAKDGEIFELEGLKHLVIGGA